MKFKLTADRNNHVDGAVLCWACIFVMKKHKTTRGGRGEQWMFLFEYYIQALVGVLRRQAEVSSSLAV